MSVDPTLVGAVVAGPVSHEVDPAALRGFAAAVGVGAAPHPCHVDRAAAAALGHADVVAPPTFAVVVTQRAEAAFVTDPASGVDFSRVVHGEQRLVHHRPVTAGDALTTSVTLRALRTMAGNELVTLRSDVVDASGAPVCTATSMLVVRAADTDTDGSAPAAHDATTGPSFEDLLADLPDPGATVVPGDDGGPGPAAPRIGPADLADLAVGQQVAAATVHLDRAALVRYADASGDRNPIHWSDAAAAGAGLPDVVAHGMLTMALTGDLAARWAGDPAAVVEHGARFTGLVPVPARGGVDVEVAAVVGAVDAAAGTVRLDLSATVDGAAVLGRARATVRPARSGPPHPAR